MHIGTPPSGLTVGSLKAEFAEKNTAVNRTILAIVRFISGFFSLRGGSRLCYESRPGYRFPDKIVFFIPFSGFGTKPFLYQNGNDTRLGQLMRAENRAKSSAFTGDVWRMFLIAKIGVRCGCVRQFRFS
jgi:hypothetical protein